MSIQLSVVLSCRLYVSFSHSHSFPTSLHYSLTDELSLRSVLNLRATRNRASAPRINKFSNTLGRWVADFAAEDSTDPNASIALASRQPHDRSAASIPQKDDQPPDGASKILIFLFLFHHLPCSRRSNSSILMRSLSLDGRYHGTMGARSKLRG